MFFIEKFFFLLCLLGSTVCRRWRERVEGEREGEKR